MEAQAGAATATLTEPPRERQLGTLARRESATADIASGASMRLTILALNFSEYRTDEPPRPLERWLPGGATVNGRGDNYADTGGGAESSLVVTLLIFDSTCMSGPLLVPRCNGKAQQAEKAAARH